jgi:hypothetical protein
MRNYEQVKIFDIKENGVDAKDKENLIWLVKYITISTTTVHFIKNATFKFDNYRFLNVKIDGYTLNLKQLRREKKLEQWQASFIKDGKTVMEVFAQWDK